MAGPPTASFSQLICRWTGPQVPFGAVTTHGFTTPVGDINDVLDAIILFAEEIVVGLSNQVTLSEIDWKVGPVATGQTVTVTTNKQGGQTTPAATPQVAYLVNLVPTGISGRFGGRFYLPGVGEGAVDQTGALDPSAYEIIQGGVLAAYAAMDVVSAEPRIFPVGSSDPRAVEAVLLSGRVATQRRRVRR